MFETKTPTYAGQPAAGDKPSAAATNPCDWIAGLFRTPTPVYKTAPEPTPEPDPDTGPVIGPNKPQAQHGRCD